MPINNRNTLEANRHYLADKEKSANNVNKTANTAEIAQLVKETQRLLLNVTQRAEASSDLLKQHHDNLRSDLKAATSGQILSLDQKQDMTTSLERLISAQALEVDQRRANEKGVALMFSNVVNDLAERQHQEYEHAPENVQSALLVKHESECAELASLIADATARIDASAKMANDSQQEIRRAAMTALADESRPVAERTETLRLAADESENNQQLELEKIDPKIELEELTIDAKAITKQLAPEVANRVRDTLGELGSLLDDRALTRLALADERTISRLTIEPNKEQADTKRLEQLRDNLNMALESTNQQKKENGFMSHLQSERIRIASSEASHLARGNLGERITADVLKDLGFQIADYKPDIKQTNQRGIDIVALKKDDKNKDVVYLIDNKALTREGNVNSVTALEKNLEDNIDTVRKHFEDIRLNNPNPESRDIAAKIITAIEDKRIKLVVTNANLTTDDSILKGVSERLEKKGVGFINVFKVKKILDASEKTQFSEEFRKIIDDQNEAIKYQNLLDVSRKKFREITILFAEQLESERKRKEQEDDLRT